METEKETLPPLESWQDSAVPPVQVLCFMRKDTKGGSPGEGKGQELRSLRPSPGPLDYPGREEEEASFLIPRLELRTITWKGNKLVPFMYPPCSVNKILFLLALALEYPAFLLPLAFLPSWHSFSLGHSFLSQAFSFLGPEQTFPPFIPSLQHSFYPLEPPLSRAHTI